MLSDHGTNTRIECHLPVFPKVSEKILLQYSMRQRERGALAYNFIRPKLSVCFIIRSIKLPIVQDNQRPCKLID